ncbi:TPA: hypothetical protein RG862_003683 [Enterobacter ludwigii]|nr:hypothetical protein [Enterobacter ludwigii]
MRIILTCFIITGLNISAGMAMTGKIQFTGSVNEPACVTDVIANNATMRCSRGGHARLIKYPFNEQRASLPYQLDMVLQNDRKQRREITVIYR